MLTPTLISKIQSSILSFWHTDNEETSLIPMLIGKERGHRMADFVDDHTCAFISRTFDSAFERDQKGEITKRSMGDIWIKENGIYHPVNIKTGIIGSEGQPNMVSLHKIIRSLTANRIDSYYLIIIKVHPELAKNPNSTEVYMLDMLDILDYITYDYGPGQIMLQSKKFFLDIEKIKIRQNRMTVSEKVQKLNELLLDGRRRFLLTRSKSITEIQKNVSDFIQRKYYTVDSASQKDFRLM